MQAPEQGRDPVHAQRRRTALAVWLGLSLAVTRPASACLSFGGPFFPLGPVTIATLLNPRDAQWPQLERLSQALRLAWNLPVLLTTIVDPHDILRAPDSHRILHLPVTAGTDARGPIGLARQQLSALGTASSGGGSDVLRDFFVDPMTAPAVFQKIARDLTDAGARAREGL